MVGRKIIAELSEIGENLVRSPLTPAQGASAICRGKAIYEELHSETKGGDRRGLARQGSANEKSAFAESTPDAIGESRRSVEITAARGEALGDDLGAVMGTSLDNGVELGALAKMPKDELRDRSSQYKSFHWLQGLIMLKLTKHQPRSSRYGLRC
jgi:ParB family transcriptional regulator, chromosome partitioning protein